MMMSLLCHWSSIEPGWVNYNENSRVLELDIVLHLVYTTDQFEFLRSIFSEIFYL